MNIFEGSRRIAIFLAILGLSIGIGDLIKNSHHRTWDDIAVIPAALFGYWCFVVIVGWIVRGFLGIPNGTDKKP